MKTQIRVLTILLTIVITFSVGSYNIAAYEIEDSELGGYKGELLRLLPYSGSDYFGGTDIEYVGYSDYNYYANKLKAIGVFKGTSGGFELDRNATRLEGLILLIRMLGKEDDALNYPVKESVFSDVPDWGVPYTNYAYDIGLTKGIGNQKFGTDQVLSTEAFFTFVLRVLGYEEGVDFKYITSPRDARNYFFLINERTWDDLNWTSYLLDRGQISYLVYETLLTVPKNSNKPLILDLIDSGDITESAFNDFLGKVRDSKESVIAEDKFISHLGEEGNYDKYDNIDYEITMYDNILRIDISNGQLPIGDVGYKLDFINSAEDGIEGNLDWQKDVKIWRYFNSQNKQTLLIPLGRYFIDRDVELIRFDLIIDEDVKSPNAMYEFRNMDNASAIVYSGSDVNTFKLSRRTWSGENTQKLVYYQNLSKMETYAKNFTTQTTTEDIKNKAIELTTGLGSDMDKLKAVYEWIGNNIDYDYEYIYNGTPLTSLYAADVFEKKLTVCDGYSRLSKAMLESVGIPTLIAVGHAAYEPDGAGHAWNMSYVNGEWITYDTTWAPNVNHNSVTGIPENLEGMKWGYFDIEFDNLYETHLLEGIRY